MLLKWALLVIATGSTGKGIEMEMIYNFNNLQHCEAVREQIIATNPYRWTTVQTTCIDMAAGQHPANEERGEGGLTATP